MASHHSAGYGHAIPTITQAYHLIGQMIGFFIINLGACRRLGTYDGMPVILTGLTLSYTVLDIGGKDTKELIRSDLASLYKSVQMARLSCLPIHQGKREYFLHCSIVHSIVYLRYSSCCRFKRYSISLTQAFTG